MLLPSPPLTPRLIFNIQFETIRSHLQFSVSHRGDRSMTLPSPSLAQFLHISHLKRHKQPEEKQDFWELVEKKTQRSQTNLGLRYLWLCSWYLEYFLKVETKKRAERVKTKLMLLSKTWTFPSLSSLHVMFLFENDLIFSFLRTLLTSQVLVVVWN